MLSVRTNLKQWNLLMRYIFLILPRVEEKLQGWKSFIVKRSPSSPLGKQALASIRDKKFHCQGGAVFSLLNPEAAGNLVSLIVSYQTISDYLDNLCDRISFLEETSFLTEQEKDTLRERSFRCLHRSMFRALQSQKGKEEDYYRFYSFGEDGGYLKSLVQESREMLATLPGYGLVRERIFFLTGLYCDLQALKHLSAENRSGYLVKWFRRYEKAFPDLFWNEFAAAAGSTLGTFVLLAAASRQNVTPGEVDALFNGYFPWICGLHILLDYFIDQDEDRREKDLNFVSFYPGEEFCLLRMEFFVRKALCRADAMPDPVFHRTVVKGLLALYLSDPKINRQGLRKSARRLLAATGDKDTLFMFHTCRYLRSRGLI